MIQISYKHFLPLKSLLTDSCDVFFCQLVLLQVELIYGFVMASTSCNSINVQEHDEIPLLIEESLVPGENGVNLTRGISGDYSRNSGENGISRSVRSKRRSVERVDEFDPKRLGMDNSRDWLPRFKMTLPWVGLHDSSTASWIAAWTIFLVFTLLVPIIGVTSVTCTNCKPIQIQLDIIIQISESSLATISFLFLSHNVRKHGLQKILFLDNIGRESRNDEFTFNKELHAALWLLAWILLPCLVGKIIYEVWWFTEVSVKVDNETVYHVILCVAILLSWLYRMSLFLFICIAFRLMCSLLLFRFEDYRRLFQENPEVSFILKEHMRIRQQLSIISHRFRVFILSSLVAITVSQFVSLFIATSSPADIDFLKAGNLVVCAAVQVTGFALCLHGAARITHRAQRVVSIASQWHALVTCRSHDISESETENMTESHAIDVDGMYLSPTEYGSDVELDADALTIVASKYESSSFQKRQAAVSYLQHSNAVISIYGFVLDRGFMYTLFGLELYLVYLFLA